MKGHIRTRQRCPVCGAPFEHIERLGYICHEHKTIPDRFFLDFSSARIRYQIFSDKSGQPISSYERAFFLLERINEEISQHRFEPSHWIRTEAAKLFVASLIEKFVEDKQRTLAPSYRKIYRYICNRIAAFFGNTDVRELRKLDILNYMKHLEKRGMTGKTLKNNLDLFRTFLNWCKDLEIMSSIPTFPTVEVVEPQIKWITLEDQATLYEMAPDEDKPILMFLILHGCRPGEARALRVKDINLANRSITISSTWSLNELRPHRKGKKSPAVTIPVHPEAWPYIEERAKTALPGAFVFTNPRSGNHYTDSALDRVWKRILKRAKITSLKKYDAFRHSFATNLVLKNTHLKKVQGLLGHTSSKTTEKYTHINVESTRAELEKLSLKKVIDLRKAEAKSVTES